VVFESCRSPISLSEGLLLSYDYTTHFETAVADLDADKAASLASIYRSGDPTSIGKPTANALVTRKGGRFGEAHRAPPTMPDPALWPAADFGALVEAFDANGFRPPCACYLNDAANIAYARRAPNGGRISLPVLFANGEYDQINTINGNRYGDPMRAACADLTRTCSERIGYRSSESRNLFRQSGRG
jgi:hypothetical protein